MCTAINILTHMTALFTRFFEILKYTCASAISAKIQTLSKHSKIHPYFAVVWVEILMVVRVVAKYCGFSASFTLAFDENSKMIRNQA